MVCTNVPLRNGDAQQQIAIGDPHQRPIPAATEQLTTTETHAVADAEHHVVQIRSATVRDASEIARLLTQLGHPTTQHEVEHRWGEWEEQGNSALVVGDDASTLLGLCQLHQTFVLHRPRPVGRITALIVDATRRGEGIGRALVAAAEARMVSAGCGLMEITSNARRGDAHAFYESISYEKTSVRLAKDMTVTAYSDHTVP